MNPQIEFPTTREMTTTGTADNSSPLLRVLVADSAPMYSALLARALHRHGQLEAVTAANPQELIEATESGLFHVVLMSAEFHEDTLQTLRLLRRVRKIDSSLALVVLLNVLDRELMVKLFQAGAQGVFLRSDSPAHLARCVECVSRGEIWVGSPGLNILVDALSEQPVQTSKAQPFSVLSRREEEVALLVAEGLSNREISDRLQLSEHTIKNYLFRMFEKLGVTTRVELALYSLEQRAAHPLPPSS